MMSVRRGLDIFEAEANIIVNPVNCMGVAGSGLALAFKERYPENHKAYYENCVKELARPGKLFITYNNNADGLAIVNFPTKKHWSHPSEYRWIENGLMELRNYLHAGDTIALPLLGCGLGKLASGEVISIINNLIGFIPDVEALVCCDQYNELSTLMYE